MGSVLSSELREDGKVLFQVLVDYEEAKQLKGLMDNVHIFSESVASIRTNISQRGKNDATKYFLIPRGLRKDIKFDSPITCQRINTKDKIIFVYVIESI